MVRWHTAPVSHAQQTNNPPMEHLKQQQSTFINPTQAPIDNYNNNTTVHSYGIQPSFYT